MNSHLGDAKNDEADRNGERPKHRRVGDPDRGGHEDGGEGQPDRIDPSSVAVVPLVALWSRSAAEASRFGPPQEWNQFLAGPLTPTVLV